MTGNIEQNVQFVRKNIAEAAKKSGRNPDDIKLIGVTKTIPPERMKELLAAGVTAIGENRVQEFLPKHEILAPEHAVEWHFIGHLQRNKVKFIADKVDLIHSVHSLELAGEIDKQARKFGRQIDILIEVNIANESTKFGLKPEEVLDFAGKLVDFANIRLKGLMCIAPFVENGSENRLFFENMRNLRVDIAKKYHYYHQANNLNLSMGMSGDYSVAIEEGATMVRVGTALFGER